MKRVALASFVGMLIEFYDAGIYGFALALVFGRVFFPALTSASATIAAFATFGAAFLARPIGAIAFGHFGDRLGRKKTLVTTLLVMGLSTFLVGLMPTTEQIGILAPICLVLLRVLQGLAAGGEWAGAVLFAAESSPEGQRGFWAMSASLGAGVAVILAPATFLLAGLVMSDEAFVAWGWRLPFLTSLLLLGVGLWIRLVMDETPVFKVEVERLGVVRFPFVEAFRNQFRVIVLAGGMMILTFCFGYLGIAYLPNYGTTILHLTRNFVLLTTVGAGFGYTAGILLGGMLSDRLGRRTTVLTAVEPRFLERTVDDWISRFEQEKIPCSPVQTVEQLVQDQQIKAMDLLLPEDRHGGNCMTLLGIPLEMTGTPSAPGSRPPKLGADTDEIFRERLGLDEAALAGLRQDAVI